MIHSLGHKDQATLGEDVLFTVHPELDLSSQITRIIPSGSYESQDFVEIVAVSELNLKGLAIL